VAIVRGTAATTLVTAATASWNPTLPTSSVGDLLLMWLCNESNPTMTTAPVGWTARGGRVVSGASDTESFVYYRVATGSDSAAHTLSSAQRGIAIVVPYTGVDATTPFDVATTHEAEASGTSWAPTGITPVTNGAELVSFIVADLSASFATYFDGLTTPGRLRLRWRRRGRPPRGRRMRACRGCRRCARPLWRQRQCRGL
jgi:hypothetical protein